MGNQWHKGQAKVKILHRRDLERRDNGSDQNFNKILVLMEEKQEYESAKEEERSYKPMRVCKPKKRIFSS